MGIESYVQVIVKRMRLGLERRSQAIKFVKLILISGHD